MVLISPPEGWILPEEGPATPAAAEKPPAPSKNGDSRISRGGALVPRESRSERPAVVPPPVRPVANSAVAIPAVVSPPEVSEQLTAPVAIEAPATEPSPAANIVPPGFTPFELPDVIAGQTYLSTLTRSFWGRMAVLGVSGFLGLAGVLAVWTVMSSRQHATDSKTDVEIAKTESADPPPVNPIAGSVSPQPQFNRRWLPEQTRLLIDIRLSKVAKQPAAMSSLTFLGPWWQPSSQALLLSLNLGPEQVRHLTWASTDLVDCTSSCVAVLELEEGIDAGRLLPASESVVLGANLVARQPREGAWPHPLLALDHHTIVSGSKDALRKLVARNGDAELISVSMESLVKKLSPSGDLAVIVDLSPTPSNVGKVPTNLLDAWPTGKPNWHSLCETPLAALGLSVQSADQRRCELGLVCTNEAAAEKTRSNIEKLVPDAIQALSAHIPAVKDILSPNKLPAEVAAQYTRLLDDLLAALRTTRCDTAEGIVWVRFGWGVPGLLISAATVIEGSPALRADWLAAARTVDEGNHRGLLRGLLSYLKAQNPPRFPDGVAGGATMLEPETRLSWIADLVPYLGHAGWHVDPTYNWNSTQNQRTTRLPLPEVINPILGPAKSSGYPVTHYVGVAGVGKDAAKLPADHAGAGVFGCGRQTRQQDLVRGGSNTIAVLGVQDQCGPWAQGGRATVRSLTQEPYVNGPDGFGSGQAEGMVAGMADGSVRFLSKNIDPHVMEQLATVRGGDQVDIPAIDPKPQGIGLLPSPEPKATTTVKPPPAAETKPPAAVDPKMQAKLDLPIARMSFRNSPLVEAVQVISAMSTLPISIDPDALEESGASLQDPITIEVANTTAAKTLEEIAAKRNLTLAVENGQLLLTSTADNRDSLRLVKYTVSDLTGNDLRTTTDLAALLQRFIVPESWQQGGGRGSMEVAPGVLQISQTRQIHYQIIGFCEKLRVARGLPTRSRLDPKKFVLTTRTAQARPILEQIVSLNVSLPCTLLSILDQFQQQSGAAILIDRPALAAIGISESTMGKFKSDKLPLGVALRQLLEPLGLTWRAVDPHTLQITSRKTVEARREVEFYRVDKLLTGEPVAELIERIKTEIPGAAWGEGSEGGAVYFDPPSKCLIVLQSRPMQIAIETLLAK